MDVAYQMLVRVLGVLLWSSAAWHKLRAPKEFRNILALYRIPAAPLHGLLALGLIVTELSLALAFCFAGAFTLACAGSAALLLLYAGVLVREIVAGRTDHPCGCAGPRGAANISWALVWRNLVLAALFLVATGSAPARPWTWLDTFTVAAAALALVVLYLALEMLAQTPADKLADKTDRT
ncbi:MAG: hypothetical protein N3C12_05435 [Candidatus Binatia bacterium]|nr:hypothetical protein [Candidatus Binatia bacterium]